jgi:hypothetical protein
LISRHNQRQPPDDRQHRPAAGAAQLEGDGGVGAGDEEGDTDMVEDVKEAAHGGFDGRPLQRMKNRRGEIKQHHRPAEDGRADYAVCIPPRRRHNHGEHQSGNRQSGADTMRHRIGDLLRQRLPFFQIGFAVGMFLTNQKALLCPRRRGHNCIICM